LFNIAKRNLKFALPSQNKGKRKEIPVTNLDRPLGFQEVEAHRFPDN
jgi:hypothetical protein